MAEVASYFDLTKLKNTWGDFLERYAIISSTAYGAQLAKSNDYNLLVEYGRTLQDMAATKRRIEKILATYQGAKEFVGLGVVPIIAASIVLGGAALLTAAIMTMDNFMKRAGIKQIQKERPGTSYEQAASAYDRTHQSTFSKAIDTTQMILLIGGAALLWMVFGRR